MIHLPSMAKTLTLVSYIDPPTQSSTMFTPLPVEYKKIITYKIQKRQKELKMILPCSNGPWCSPLIKSCRTRKN